MKIRILIFAFVTAFATGAFAEVIEVTPVPEKTFEEKAKSALEVVTPVENARLGKEYLANVSYSALEFPIPSKFGVTVGLVTGPDKTWEIEYMTGSLSVPGGFRDLGSIKDERFSLIGRKYFGNSFHLSYGLSYFNFTADVGSALINGASGGVYPSMNAMTVQGFGANIGIGNTWVFRKNITVGVDWLSLAQPMVITRRGSDFTKNSNDANKNQYMDDTMKIVSYLPRFAAINVHAGMLF